MRQSSIVLVLAAQVLSLAACAPLDEGGDDAEVQENGVKKKVAPTGGNGAFDLDPPTFDITGFAGTFRFGGADIAVGERREKVPGTYGLESSGVAFTDGRTINKHIAPIAITAGAVARQQVGGVRVRFAEPLSLGGSAVTLRPPAGTGNAGTLTGLAGWRSLASGAGMLTLPGPLDVTSTAGAAFNPVVVAGALAEVVLPVARLTVAVDAYDPAYPSPSCASVFVVAGVGSDAQKANVRKSDGSPAFAVHVVPQGASAPVVLNAMGIQLSLPTVSGQTHKFTLNRLEVDDVAVAQAGGGAQLTKGTVTVSRRQQDGTFAALSCVFPTHSGIDLPDGVYSVKSVAQSPSGRIEHVADVTFP